MKIGIQFLTRNRWSIAILLAVGAAFIPANLRGQDPAVLDKTTLGKSQNSTEDRINSLIPGPEKFGKGEKKQQIDAKDLKSKSIKDSTFGGSLLNTGIIGTEPKLDEQKVHNAPTAKDSGVTKQSTATSDKKPASSSEPQSTDQSQATEKESSFFTLSETAALQRDIGETNGAQSEVSADAHSSATSETVKSDDQKKDQTGSATNSSTTEDKSSSNSSEKTSPSKPDGDH